MHVVQDGGGLQAGAAFAEARGGCITVGDATTIGNLLDEAVTFAETDLGDDGSSASRKCASSRRTAAGTQTTSTTVATSTVPGAVSFAADVQPIFDANCVFCHTGSFPPIGLSLTAGVSYSNLVNAPSGECTSTARVAPNSPSTSYLVHKLAGEGPCFMGSRMPLHLSPLTPVQQAVVWTWILRGALND